jgi:hypothetical protein
MNPNLLDVFGQLGFIDKTNYISCTRENIRDKINYIIDKNNLDEINKIRKAGQELIINKHSCQYRLETFIKILENDFSPKKEFNDKFKTNYFLAF